MIAKITFLRIVKQAICQRNSKSSILKTSPKPKSLFVEIKLLLRLPKNCAPQHDFSFIKLTKCRIREVIFAF